MAVRNGFIYVWEQLASGIEHWDDGISWKPVASDSDFWTSREKTLGNGLLKKTISVPAQGRFHHIVSYYNPWDTINGRLRAPSDDLNLANVEMGAEWGSGLTTPSLPTPHNLLPPKALKVNPLIELGSRASLTMCRHVCPTDIFSLCEALSSFVGVARMKTPTKICCNVNQGIGSHTSCPIGHTGLSSPAGILFGVCRPGN